MFKAVKKIKNSSSLFLILIIAAAVFFYSFNLENTYWFAADMARDTLQSLRILQTKKLTLIGPPITSFGPGGIKEVYFGSLSYYLAVLGLLITGNNPLGPIYINGLLMIIGLVCLYKLAQSYLKNDLKALFTTFLYALSPLVVIHLRFYWNPNYILSLAPIFWFAYEKSRLKGKNSTLFAVIAGIMGGLLINLHYFVAPVVFLVLVNLLISLKNKKSGLLYGLGLIIGLSPLILFELRNHFYLTQAFIYNLSRLRSVSGLAMYPWYLKIVNSLRILLIFFGFDYEATFIPVFFKLVYWQKLFLGVLCLCYLIFKNQQSKTKIRSDIVFYLLISIVITVLASQEELYIRYFFVCLPLLALMLGKLLNNKLINFLLLINIILVATNILTFQIHQRNKNSAFPTLDAMRQAVKYIRQDRPEAPYNITESFLGDARALYLRFFLEKDPIIIKPNKETEYENLKTLYVFAPNLEIVQKEKRWEFTATKNLHLEKSFQIGENKYLYKFVRY